MADPTSPCQQSEGTERSDPYINNNTQGANTTRNISGKNSNRKRVFTFQKRWLHSLPIMEKTLPLPSGNSKIKLRDQQINNDKMQEDGIVEEHDIIVCMLCEEGTERSKFWSRVNCRRGRIENHLMGRHPEFMMLLKQKQKNEGELSVQIYLQAMREGGCNLRNEIITGLCNHMQLTHPSPSSTSMAAAVMAAATSGSIDQLNATHIGMKRPLADEFTSTSSQQSLIGKNGFVQMLHSEDAQHKRTKIDADTTSELPFYRTNGPTSAIFANKHIVLTGGEKSSIVRLATDFWVMGANVLVTFSDITSMNTFSDSTAHFNDMESVETPRGMIIPLYWQHKQLAADDWSRAISMRFPHVDILINYVETNNASDQLPSTNQVLELCHSICTRCIQKGRCISIINITTESDEVRTSTRERNINCIAIDTFTKSLSSVVSMTNVRINTILLQHTQISTTQDENEVNEEITALSHTLLFLLSPSSSCISDSIMRIRVPIPTPLTNSERNNGDNVDNVASVVTPNPFVLSMDSGGEL